MGSHRVRHNLATEQHDHHLGSPKFQGSVLKWKHIHSKELHIVKFPTGIYCPSDTLSEADERVGEKRPGDGHTGLGRDPPVQTRDYARYHLTGWHSSAPRWRRSAKNNHLPPSICNLGNCFCHLSSLALYKYCLLQMLEEVVEREKEEK